MASAQKARAALKRQGLVCVSLADRSREGLRLSMNFGASSVRVAADLDRPGEAARLSSEAEEALVAEGFEISRSAPDTFYATAAS